MLRTVAKVAAFAAVILALDVLIQFAVFLVATPIKRPLQASPDVPTFRGNVQMDCERDEMQAAGKAANVAAIREYCGCYAGVLQNAAGRMAAGQPFGNEAVIRRDALRACRAQAMPKEH